MAVHHGRNRQLFGSASSGRNQLRKAALSGGAPVTLCIVDGFAGGAWADDDTVYFIAASPGRLMRIPAAGGQPQEAATIDFAKGERIHKFPCALPGGQAVLFTVAMADAETFDDARVAVLDTRTGQRKTLIEGGTHPRYSPSGHIVYARAGNLLAVRCDPEALAVVGQPVTVLEGVLMSVNSGVANFDISASGDLVYVPGGADKGGRTLVWVDRNGSAEPLGLPPRSYLHPRISPDDHQLAIEIEGPNHDFYVYDFARSVLSKMTTDGVSHWPVWSPDGTQLVYRAGPMAGFKLWEMPADRSRPAAQLPAEGISQSAESWSPDGHAIAYTAVTPEAGAHYSHGMSASCGPPGATSSNYDVTADGRRFLMIRDDDQDRVTSKQIVVVQGWADEVRRLSART